MNSLLEFIAIAFFSWRLLVSVSAAGVISFLWFLLLPGFNSLAAVILVLLSVGFGLFWEGGAFNGKFQFTAPASPPPSKPVVFLGLLFLGALWGALISATTGSFLLSVALLAGIAFAFSAWYSRSLKRPFPWPYFCFALVALVSGVLVVYFVVSNHGTTL